MPALHLAPGASPVRLDAFVRRARPQWSRRFIARLVAEGEIRVNGSAARKGDAIGPQDQVTVPDLAGLTPEPTLALAVVYKDPHLLVLEKPGGVPSHALDPRERGTLAAALLARYPEVAGVGAPLAPGLAHRLDTGTSGLLIAARSVTCYQALRGAFRARAIEKQYLAVVGGVPPLPATVDLPLMHDPQHPGRMVAARGSGRAWPAGTRLALRHTTGVRSLVEATMHTGVTHQIRAHLAALEHPLLGDPLYGGASCELPQDRHALHATRLRLVHPITGEQLDLSSPLPPDLAALIGRVP